MRCPICGNEVILSGGMYHCSHFPICNFSFKPESEDGYVLNPDRDTFIVFDLETTGLNKTNDRIIEIGAVKVVNGEVTDNFDLLVNPGVKDNGIKFSISSTIQNLTGISIAMVAKAPSEKEALSEFFKWCDGINLIVGHNIASFDIPFTKSACRRNELEFPFTDRVDTLLFAKSLKLQKDGIIENNKQPTLAKYVGLTYHAHRANDDTQALYEILTRLVHKQNKMPLIESI